MSFRGHLFTNLVLGIILGSSLTLAAESPRVSLLELYTSEGCNSCPPADRWVSALPRPQLVPGKLVVLAFHVDYWNYLGWNDRFSQRHFTERQQAMVRAQNLRTAYTPQLLLNGRDFRGTSTLESRLAEVTAQPAAYELKLDARLSQAALNINVLVTPTRKTHQDQTELYVAVYENNLTTEVKAGENHGERLRHDYVVRTLIGPVAINTAATRWSGNIPLAGDWKTGDLGVAVGLEAAHHDGDGPYEEGELARRRTHATDRDKHQSRNAAGDPEGALPEA